MGSPSTSALHDDALPRPARAAAWAWPAGPVAWSWGCGSSASRAVPARGTLGDRIGYHPAIVWGCLAIGRLPPAAGLGRVPAHTAAGGDPDWFCWGPVHPLRPGPSGERMPQSRASASAPSPCTISPARRACCSAPGRPHPDPAELCPDRALGGEPFALLGVLQYRVPPKRPVANQSPLRGAIFAPVGTSCASAPSMGFTCSRAATVILFHQLSIWPCPPISRFPRRTPPGCSAASSPLGGDHGVLLQLPASRLVERRSVLLAMGLGDS